MWPKDRMGPIASVHQNEIIALSIGSYWAAKKLNSCTTLMLVLVALSWAAPAQAGDPMLPDRKLTPGKIARRQADRKGVSESMERKIFARYGIPWTRRSEFKIDHLIPTELGGADDIDNLWPQSVNVRPYNARRKEQLTQRFLALIAEGRMNLAQAQEEIRQDWISAFVNHLGMVYLR
jgi:hypothetical protein